MNLTQELTYFVNYKPLLNFRKDISSFNKIYCKNFFLFFLLLENILDEKKLNQNNKNSFFKKTTLKIHKKIKYSQSFLRAPNKYKKAQIRIALIRYQVLFKFEYFYSLQNLSNLNISNLFYFLNFYFNFISFFESNLFYLNRKRLIIKFNSDYLKIYFLEL